MNGVQEEEAHGEIFTYDYAFCGAILVPLNVTKTIEFCL